MDVRDRYYSVGIITLFKWGCMYSYVHEWNILSNYC